ncbi:telomere length regulation protein TEL2 homolog [Nymphalis io]|uniref:telomere length regulation protein TEL2 homolog n=1 Tax=Inachis io TaxID=171585 RepID=UPI00216A6314|nr:telomere length regulation protein TEL2 homolog [Nymphalis io]
MDRFISMWKVRELADKVTNVVMNYTEVEGKVREATSDEAWGPTGQQMQELALATFTYEHFPEVMSMLWRRMLHDNRSHWRRTYKCLLLLSYLVRNGSERVVTSAREHIYDLRSLENYTFVDDLGKDQGINVRHKVRELIDFIQDDEKLREERKKAKKNKDKYIGMSSEAVVLGARGGGGGGGGGWGEYSDRSTSWDDSKERNDEDDYEREDSDGEYGNKRPNNAARRRDEYRDADAPAPAPGARPARARAARLPLGAASTYGKTPVVTIAPAAINKNTNKSQELLDDLFKTCPVPNSPGDNNNDSGNSEIISTSLIEDDFDPRAEERASVPKAEADFGDFTAAFGPPAPASSPTPTPTPAPTLAPPPSVNEFADFSAFHLQPAPAVPANTSNLSLLSDLEPPSQPLSFDLDSLSTQMASSTLQPTGDEPPPPRRLVRALRHFVATLRAEPRVRSRAHALRVADAGERLRRELAGPLTAARLGGADPPRAPPRALAARARAAAVRALLPHWPAFRDDAAAAFAADAFPLALDALADLCGFLRRERDGAVLRALAALALAHGRGDAPLAAAVACARSRPAAPDWEAYVQLLATLPERVANRLRAATPRDFSHENYSYVLLFHIVRCIDYMAESSFHEGAQFDLRYLAHLLSKFVTSYSLSNAEGVYKFVDILVAWTDTDSADACRFVRKKLIQTLLSKLSRQAIDKMSLILLTRSPINYKTKDQAIRNVLGNNIDTNKDWYDILTFRIPFYVHPKDFRDTRIPENLIYYISTSKNSIEILTEMILRLSKTWSDVHLNNVVNIDHHMHTSILLVLAVKYRVVIWRMRKSPWDMSEMKRILYKGMSKHLDIISQEFRCVGMATIEILFKMIVEVDDSDKKAVDCLNFDFEELGQLCIDIFNTLQAVTQKCIIDDKCKKPNVDVRVIDLKKNLDEIAERFSGNVERPVHNTIVTCAVKGPQQTKEIVKTIISAKLDALGKTGKSVDLDSDDDLQPYDMSNDVPVTAKKKPKYLRDLLEIINEGKDMESFEAALTAAENLVTKQLKGEDEKLAIDLLDVFIHLDEKFHVDGFNNLKFKTAVAIVCSQPKVCAEHLCKEIHSDVGRYSIATKILMLDVFTEAAERIADMKTEPEEKQRRADGNQTKELPRDEILRRRLLKKTKYFHSKRPHPFSKAKKNIFASVSDHFFYPLISGFGYRQLTLSHHNMKQDVDKLLLLRYLSAVGTIILVSKNCPKCPIYCREILQMVLYLRFTPDPKIQTSVLSIIASIAVALPESFLKGEYYEVMMELSSWLVDCLTNADLTHRLGGPKSDAVIFAGEVLHLLESVLSE